MLSDISQTKTDKYHVIHLCVKSKQTNKHNTQLIDTENIRVVAGVWRCGVDEGGQKVQTSSYKVNAPWGCNAWHRVCG